MPGRPYGTNEDGVTQLKPTDSQKCTLLQQVFDGIEDGIMVLDRGLNILLANRSLENRFGGNTPLAGQKCHEALFGRDTHCPACPSIRSLEKCVPHTQVVKLSTNRFRPEWFELVASPLQDETGAVTGVVESLKNITKHKLLDEQLRDETAWRRLVFDESEEGILILDLDGKVREANPRCAMTLDYTHDEIRRLHIWDIDGQAGNKERLLESLQHVDVIGNRFETIHLRKDGTPVPVQVKTTGIVHAGEKLVFYACRDISEKKAMEEQIRQLGIRDPLTGLYDRRYILERLAESPSEYSRVGTHFSISILNLDHFASVNEINGHRAGDLALTEFARTISSIVRPYDLVGRYGGDAFVIVSRNTTVHKSMSMIQRIMNTVRNKDFVFEGHKLRLTFSCGQAHSSEFPREGMSIEDMLALVEERLRQAKSEGRDRFVGPQSA
jgi:diguanylate cyclase (GGDEF)-like protein/PAS domain S-box-containing protein